MPRRAHTLIAQIRAGASTLTKDTLKRFGQSDTDECPACQDPASITHMMLDCPAYQGPRQRRWGPVPTMNNVLEDSATTIWSYLQDEVGRVPPDPASAG